MTQAAGLIERIQALLAEAGVPATPSNYEFFYRYVTGVDPQLVEAVDAVRTRRGLDQRSIGTIRHELYGTGSGVGQLLDDTERQLAQISDVVERSDAGARDYRERLDQSHLNAAGTLERQRSMLVDMLDAANTMIAQTEQLQGELARSSDEIDRLKSELEVARIESRSDALTGLSNRKACCDYLEAQITRARADGKPLSLIFIDIDHFKRFNDDHGHRMGDEVLRLVGQSLERSFHGVGFVARWGGEEFVAVLPGHDAREAAGHAERFRGLIAARRVQSRQSGREVGRITLSLGVAALREDDCAQTLTDRADAALYDAKADGRDRVVTWSRAA